MSQLPKVILYNAVSLDSRIKGFNPDIGLYYELAGTFQEDLTLFGSETILNVPDEIPEEKEEDWLGNAESSQNINPLFAICDSKGRVKTWHYWKKQPYWRDGIALCSANTPPEHLDYLEKRDIKKITTGTHYVDFHEALIQLKNSYGLERVRVDSGGKLNSVLIQDGLVDEINLLVHPCLVGGKSSENFYQASSDFSSLKLETVEVVKDDFILMKYSVTKSK